MRGVQHDSVARGPMLTSNSVLSAKAMMPSKMMTLAP